MGPELTLVVESTADDVPEIAEFSAWASALVELRDSRTELAIRVVDGEESRELNHRYRNRDAPTNVLSFPADLPEEVVSELEFRPLGDLVICAPLVVAEAVEQGKQLQHHWAHLTIHGLLHLLGFDHQDEASARIMESREREMLADLGIADPYRA